MRIWRCSGRVEPSRRQYGYPYRLRNASRMSSILVICVKMSTLCPPDFSVRSSCASACSFPQSNCTNRRSGKKSCCRTLACRSGASAGQPTFCDHLLSRASAVRIDAHGAEHVIVGGGARAFGIANMNVAIRSFDSDARVVGRFTADNTAGAAAKGPAPNASASTWQSRAASDTVTARRRSAPYTGARRTAAAAAIVMRLATARRSTFAAAARASRKSRTAASAAGVIRPIRPGGATARAYAPPSARVFSTSAGSAARRAASAAAHASRHAPSPSQLTSSRVRRWRPRGAKNAAPSGSSCLVLASLATMEGTRRVTPGSISNAETIGRPAKRSGWLHTFRSCIRQLMMPRRFPLASVVEVSEEAMYSSYSRRWRLERPQCTTCSVFPGRFFSTSVLRRRKRNGRSTPWRRETRSMLTPSPPSTIPASG